MPAGGGGHGGGDGGHGLHTGGDSADVSFLINENPVEQGTVARVVKWVVLLLMLGCMLQMAEIASATTGTEIEAEKVCWLCLCVLSHRTASPTPASASATATASCCAPPAAPGRLIRHHRC